MLGYSRLSVVLALQLIVMVLDPTILMFFIFLKSLITNILFSGNVLILQKHLPVYQNSLYIVPVLTTFLRVYSQLYILEILSGSFFGFPCFVSVLPGSGQHWRLAILWNIELRAVVYLHQSRKLWRSHSL